MDSHLAPSGLLGDLGLAWAWRLLTVAAWVRLRTAIPSNAFRATRHVFEKTLRAMSLVTESEKKNNVANYCIYFEPLFDLICLSIVFEKRGATSHYTSLTNNTGYYFMGSFGVTTYFMHTSSCKGSYNGELQHSQQHGYFSTKYGFV